VILLLAQVMLSIAPEPLPKVAPPTAAIERSALRTSPQSLFADLSSNGEQRRKDALDTLGLEWMQGRYYGDAWWLLGSFSCCGPLPFVEWKELVWPGTKDLIIHGSGVRGTGVGQTTLTAYRIWRGRLTAGRTTRIGHRQSYSCNAFRWRVARFSFAPTIRKKGECSQ
jgi:hypothetical protein